MPIQPHYACEKPADDTPICRFMPLPFALDFLANEELYFRRTDLYKNEDPWEALPSDEYVRSALGLRKGIIEDELELNESQAFVRQTSEASYLSCWQLFEGESVHMWDRYGKRDGIAFFSTYARLEAAVSAFLDPVLIGKVKYTEEGRQRYNLIDFLFTKRQPFERERELRVVVQCYDPVASTNRHYDQNGVPHREPLDALNLSHPWVHDCKRRRIALNTLITEIRVSPWASPSIQEDIKVFHKNKNLDCPIVESELTNGLTPTPKEMKKYGF